MSEGGNSVTIQLIQGGVAVIVALIAAFGGGYSAGKSSDPPQTLVTEPPRMAPGILQMPAEVTKSECAQRLKSTVEATGFVMAYHSDDAARWEDQKSAMGFWCAKRQVVFYYGLAKDMDDAIALRSGVRIGVNLAGGREPGDN